MGENIMDEKEFDYEEYRNNLEKAVEIHDKFYRLRNMLNPKIF